MSREMDIEGESSGALGQMDDLESYAFENENCGICGDIIINRGVLDCCQHCFCYTCIDNWSAITNRCPLCKIEFQHITSTLVYDMTGGTTEDEYPLASGDDDWFMQGESSALSFPSYYIDADAVHCLGDSDCKIRSGLVVAEGDSTLDTSIACDSCDKWYHALCVGFNPETAIGNSWLCPRCMATDVKHNADVILKQNFSEEYVTGSDRKSTETSFSGRVSVSIADEGETALVVSMVGVHPEIKSGLSEVPLGLKTTKEAFDDTSGPSYSKNDFTHDTVADASNLRNTDGFSRSQYKSSGMNTVCAVSSVPPVMSLQFSPIHDSTTDLFSSEQGNMSNEHLEASKLVSHCSDGTFSDNSMKTENKGQDNKERSIIKSPEFSSQAREMARLHDKFMVDADAVQQMKSPQNMGLPLRHDEHKSSDRREKGMRSESDMSRPAKKTKFEVQEQEMNLIENFSVSSTHSQTTSVSAEATCGDMSEVSPEPPSVPDILSIVEEEDYKRDLGREQAKPVGRRAGDKPGLRVKKIFRKEGNESSVMVQKLQQEIREVVRDTGTNILEKDGSFDEKLLTAFRAAIGKPVEGLDKNANLSLIRTKRSLLQKGKKRENLTKKLYGTSTGRRRSAWHRDWEVEFWKYRCSPGVNPEKIETLQSVLQLLKKSSEMDKETARGKKEENNDSIMSRLYLADASVIPRKDDIKPLSVLSGCAPLDKNSETKASNVKSPNKCAVGTELIRISSPSSTGNVSSSIVLNKETTSRRENRNNHPSQNQKQTADSIKHDKRKWALEILARKQASSVTSKDQNRDIDALKGNFPILAQLPADMRPQPTAGRNNMVPLSVRQAQLHRIAEHYLQKANLDVIRRCADTELAIADAVNVEKDIYERSNSKLVYMNLCSQAARQPAKAKSDNGASALIQKTESGSDLMSQQVTSESTKIRGTDTEDALNRAVISDQKREVGDDIVQEQTECKLTFSFSSAEEALKQAGLFDSPPNSPERKITALEEGSHRCTLDLNSEPSKILQSSPKSRLKDVSSLNDNSIVMSFGKPKANSEEYQKLTPSRVTDDMTTSETNATNLAEADRCFVRCERTSGLGKEISVESNMPDEGIGHVDNSKDTEKTASRLPNPSPSGDGSASEGEVISKPKNLEPSREKSSSDNPLLNMKHPKGDDKSTHPAEGGDSSKKPTPGQAKRDTSDPSTSIHKKVEMFIKEHIRPLCKSGVITVDQYRWAVAKTRDKVMNFHREAKNANFLIKEGDKVKRLALQYVEAAQEKVN